MVAQASDASRENLVIGIFGIGLDTYRDQFKGLKDRLIGYQKGICNRIATEGVCVIDAGLVDSPEKAQATASRLAHCQACSIPEIASVFKRARIPFRVVTGFLEDEEAWKEVSEWILAACVQKGMARNRVGLMGHYYCGMLDVYSDLTQQAAVFGNHFEIVEIDELSAIRDCLSDDEIEKTRNKLSETFAIDAECSEAELVRASRTTAALLKMAEQKRLGSIAYYYEGQPGNPHQDIMTSIIPGNTLLTASHVPVAGEYEV